MIYINHIKKAVFIHIPKTGGSYIGPTLVKYYGFKSYLHLILKRRPDHNFICKSNNFKKVLTGNKVYDNSFFNKYIGLLLYCKTSNYLNEKMNMNDDKWNTYKKFCFVRHPYERALSGWKHFNIILNTNDVFFDYINNNKYDVSDIEYGHIFMNQVEQISNLDGSCGVDIIGKFENLEEDFVMILRELGFEKILHIPIKVNVSNTDEIENMALEPKTIKRLNELFSNDLELLHYKHLVITN